MFARTLLQAKKEATVSNLMLDVDQVRELKSAFRRGKWTSDEIKRSCEGDILAQFRQVVLGNAKIVSEALLEFVGTGVFSSAITEKILVRDHIANLKSNGAKISTWNNFESWLFNKKMKPAPKAELKYYKMRENSADSLIVAELGGKKKAETTIEDFFSIMEMQLDGRSGTLLTDGRASIFYIRDAKGKLRVVYCHLKGSKWNVGAVEVDGPRELDAGCQVFSPEIHRSLRTNSSLEATILP